MVYLTINGLLDHRKCDGFIVPLPSWSCLSFANDSSILPSFQVCSPDPMNNFHLWKYTMISKFFITNAHPVLNLLFPLPHSQMKFSWLTLTYTSRLSSDITSDYINSILYPVVISGTTLKMQSYIFTCVDSTTHKQKQTYFSYSMALTWKPNSSSGA
jgi:hypothetical protein